MKKTAYSGLVALALVVLAGCEGNSTVAPSIASQFTENKVVEAEATEAEAPPMPDWVKEKVEATMRADGAPADFKLGNTKDGSVGATTAARGESSKQGTGISVHVTSPRGGSVYRVGQKLPIQSHLDGSRFDRGTMLRYDFYYNNYGAWNYVTVDAAVSTNERQVSLQPRIPLVDSYGTLMVASDEWLAVTCYSGQVNGRWLGDCGQSLYFGIRFNLRY